MFSSLFSFGNKKTKERQYDKVGGRFSLRKTLGEGAFGKVKLATDETTGDLVAVKLMKPEKQSQTDLDKKNEEICAMASLKHDNVVNVICYANGATYKRVEKK